MRCTTRIHLKPVLILGLVGFGLLVSAAVAYKLRKRILAQRALVAGKQAIEQEDWKTACDQLPHYLSTYPNDQEILQLYGRANLAVRPLELRYVMGAIGAYRRLLRLRPDDVETSELLCCLNAFTGEFVVVEDVAENWFRAAPQDPDANLWLARALIGQGRRGEATEKLAAWVQSRPTDVDACLLLSELALADDPGAARTTPEQWSRAREWIDQCLETNPRSATALARRARFRRLHLTAEADGVSSEDRASIESAALQDLDAAAALEPGSPDLLLLMAEEWLAWQRLDRAATTIVALNNLPDEALDDHYVDPADFRLNHLILSSRLATALGDKSRFEDLARQSLEVLPRRQRLAFIPIAVELLLAAGDFESAKKAVQELRYAVEEDITAPTEALDQVELQSAVVAHACGEHFAAIQRTRELLARRPDSPMAWRLLWQALEATEQPRQARNALERFVSLAPTDFEARLALARALVKDASPDWRKIFAHADAAERIKPGLLEVRILRIGGRLLGRAGPPQPVAVEQIGAQLVEIRRQHPREGMVRLLEASLALLRDRTDDAITILEEAIRESDSPTAAAQQLARIHLRNGRPDAAVAACEAAVERRPDDADAWIVLAEQLIEIDRPDEARRRLGLAAEKLQGPHRLKAEMTLTRLLTRRGDRAAAIERLDILAAGHPENVAIREMLLDLPEIQSDRSRAEELIRQIQAIETEDGLRWRAERARLLSAGEDWQKHEAEITELAQLCLDADPRHGLAAAVLGRLHEKAGRWYEAERVYGDAISADPTAARAAEELLRLLESQGRFAEAKAILERVHDDSGALQRHHAIIAYARGRLHEARSELKSLLRRHPDDVAVRVLFARVIRDSGRDTDAALKVLDQARTDPDERAPISRLRALLLTSAGRADEALAFLDAEVRKFDDATAYLLRAVHLAEAGELDRAEQDYKRIKELPESKALGHELLGEFYAGQGRTEAAVAEWEAGIAAEPGHLELRISLTRALLASTDPARRQRGGEELKKLLTNHPRNTLVRLALAEHLFTGNEAEAAAELLEQVVQDEPASVPAHLQLINIKRALGDVQSAYIHAVRAIGRNPDNPALLLEKADLELKLGRHGLAKATAAAVVDRWSIDKTTRNRAQELLGLAELYLIKQRNDKHAIAEFLSEWRANHPDVLTVLTAGEAMMAPDDQPPPGDESP